MGSIRIYKGMPLSKKDLECLEELSKMSDKDIDYSDIPKMTKEELKKFKPARLRLKNREKVAS